MSYQTVLGFDFGMKYIGVAIGQTITCTASPLPTIPAKQGIPDWAQMNVLIERWRPDLLMVGMPYSPDGSKQAIALRAEHFMRCLQERYQLPVKTVDERFTTQEAKRYLFEHGGYRALKKSSIDGLSAKIIVECGMQEL